MSRLLAALMGLFLSGCIHLPFFEGASEAPVGPKILNTAYTAADHLHSQMSGSGVAGYPMLAASFVDSTDVEKSSDLGRLLSEQVASRLSQVGYSVTEIQLRSDQLAVRPEGGVFALSRDVAEINTDVSAYSVLVGTFTVIERQIYVNARVLRASDGVALASSDFILPAVRQSAKEGEGRGAQVRPSVGTSLN
jgi:TolB-like protein